MIIERQIQPVPDSGVETAELTSHGISVFCAFFIIIPPFPPLLFSAPLVSRSILSARKCKSKERKPDNGKHEKERIMYTRHVLFAHLIL